MEWGLNSAYFITHAPWRKTKGRARHWGTGSTLTLTQVAVSPLNTEAVKAMQTISRPCWSVRKCVLWKVRQSLPYSSKTNNHSNQYKCQRFFSRKWHKITFSDSVHFSERGCIFFCVSPAPFSLQYIGWPDPDPCVTTVFHTPML